MNTTEQNSKNNKNKKIKSKVESDGIKAPKRKREESFSLRTYSKCFEAVDDFNSTESHEGIEYEFQRKPIKNVKITSCTVSDLYPKNNVNPETSQIGVPIDIEKLKNDVDKLIKKKNKEHNKKYEVLQLEQQLPPINKLKINIEKKDIVTTTEKSPKIKQKQTKNQMNSSSEESPLRVKVKQKNKQMNGSREGLPLSVKVKQTNKQMNSSSDESSPSVKVKQTKKQMIAFRKESPAKPKEKRLNKEKDGSSEDSPCTLIPILSNKSKFYSFAWENDQKLIILKDKETIVCHGHCSLKVLHGKIEILGCILDKHAKITDIYSPRGSSLLNIKNVTDDGVDIENLEALKQHDHLKQTTINKQDAIFVYSRTENDKIKFLEQHVSECLFPKMNINSPQISFHDKEKFNSLIIHPEWDRIINMVDKSSKMLIVGGRGVGKSTFVRYSVNRLLMKFNKIRVIDLDPGQSEFTVPGCISVMEVSEPILGPSYTHLRRTKSSLLSNIDAGHSVNRYIFCIKDLMNSVTDFGDMPTVINYMGFTNHIGINIACSAITFIKPTHLVQIKSLDDKNNFEEKLKGRVIKNYCKMFESDKTAILKYTFIEMMSMSNQRKGVWTLKPRQVREMAVVAYFAQIMSDDVNHLSSHKIPMYKIKFSDIKLTNDKGQKMDPAAINAQLVALCSKMNYNGYYNVLGYGVVREINVSENRLVLITPEPLEIIEKVFCLVKSSVSLPPSMYMAVSDVSTSVPFVMKGELNNPLDQMTKRSFLPANKILV